MICGDEWGILRVIVMSVAQDMAEMSNLLGIRDESDSRMGHNQVIISQNVA